MITLLIPVLGRPERAAPLVESIHEATEEPHEIVFLASPHDAKQIAAALETGERVILCPFDRQPGDYARKINYGITQTTGEWIFQGADDVRFHRGWDAEALAVGAPVTGTNDLGNPLVMRGGHATHSLVQRAYVEEQGTIDGDGLLHEGYSHCWVDNELVETARARGAWKAARRSHVEHLHHIWHKGSDDATYRQGQAGYQADFRLFTARRPLWRSVRTKR